MTVLDCVGFKFVCRELMHGKRNMGQCNMGFGQSISIKHAANPTSTRHSLYRFDRTLSHVLPEDPGQIRYPSTLHPDFALCPEMAGLGESRRGSSCSEREGAGARNTKILEI